MKKIMFNDRYGLTQAVLDGRKTMTRRIIKGEFEKVTAYHANGGWCFLADTKDGETIVLKPQYLECEKVAVAQSYHELNKRGFIAPEWCEHTCESSAAYNNKMFVRADLMPHRIHITDIKVERLQDISDEDCMKEGVFKYEKPVLHHENDMYAPWPPYVKAYKYDCDNLQYRCNARAAFKTLIDRISGKGTWERNPWVYAYEFELIK